MLVTRQLDSGRHSWSPKKLGAFQDGAASPRMSNLEGSNGQPDWREHYPHYIPQISGSLLPPHVEQPQTNSEASTSYRDVLPRQTLEHRHSTAQLNGTQDLSGQTIERPESAPPGSRALLNPERHRHDSVLSNESANGCQDLDQPYMGSTSHSTQTLTKNEPLRHSDHTDLELKDEDDDDLDDDMFDAEESGGGPQTEAERRAERRKLKRFRLTHQQTRFLMSEFSRQAHPDTAHRERLSKDIPGLSPRQVQVWFQNRRAKIKRLNADDRDRMMKMRAVPEDFDNAGALHSPYGAIHPIGQPMPSPVDYGSGYGDQGLMRPLLVDTMRRQEVEESMSSSGISPAFSHIGFAPSGSIGTSEGLSPVSLNAPDRYYSSHIPSPASTGPRSSNPFLRQNSTENYGMQSQTSSHHPRPIQPLALRDTLSRSRSESLQSPLRSSMSWKGDSLDYGNYSGETSSPPLTGRQQSLYQPETSNSGPLSAQSYASNAYSNAPQSSYPTSQPTSSSSVPSLSRFRASSSAYPPNLELRNQYRALSSQQPTAHTPMTPNHPPTPRQPSFAPFTSGGYQSAPLLAPHDFHLPRTPGQHEHSNLGPNSNRDRDFSMSQLSAPIAAPHDFGYTSHGHGSQLLSPNRLSSHSQPHGQDSSQDQRRDNSDFPAHPTQSNLAGLLEQTHRGENAGFVRDGYTNSHEEEASKRKRTYSMGSYQTS